MCEIPHADTSLYPIPNGADEEALVMLSDVLPTGFECGVLNGKVAPGSTVAIVGSGPIGLAALLTAQFYSPAEIIMIDLDDNRLGLARQFGATHTVNTGDGKAAETVKALTGGRGVDTAIEAVGGKERGMKELLLATALAALAALRCLQVALPEPGPGQHTLNRRRGARAAA